MIGRYRVSLDDVQMDELIPQKEVTIKTDEEEKVIYLDNGIIIHDVEYTPLEQEIQQNTVANLDGYDIAKINNVQRTVTVTFELHMYDTVERNKACQTINAWAKNGGKLRINDREGQYLLVVCKQFVDVLSVRDWTKTLTLVFTTTIVPYWLSDEPSVLTLVGANQSGMLNLDGNFGFSPVSIEATATTWGTASFKATVGSTVISLTGISLSPGGKIVIDYPNIRYIRVLVSGGSAISKVAASSSDRLLAECGKSTKVTITSPSPLRTTVQARGQWL